MSHEYSMRIEVHGAHKSQVEAILDEIVPRWWNGDYGEVSGLNDGGHGVWVEGKDRLCGGTGPREFQEDLEVTLQNMFGDHIRVVVLGEDREGEDYGKRFHYGPP